MLKGFTDYPITELGDHPNQEAPIRECYITGYDGNKHIEIVVDGVIKKVKARHIFDQRGRVGDMPSILKTKPEEIQALAA